MKSLTRLIQHLRDGGQQARDQLFAAAYPELRKLARARLRDGGRGTVLETTALVHESYLRFLKSADLHIEDRKAFFAYVSRVMRSVIVDTVRERQAERRGGDCEILTLDTGLRERIPSCEAEILHVHEALAMLAALEPRVAQVVEMRYFAGYSTSETAEALGLTVRTVGRDWEKGCMLLTAMLKT